MYVQDIGSDKVTYSQCEPAQGEPRGALRRKSVDFDAGVHAVLDLDNAALLHQPFDSAFNS